MCVLVWYVDRVMEPWSFLLSVLPVIFSLQSSFMLILTCNQATSIMFLSPVSTINLLHFDDASDVMFYMCKLLEEVRRVSRVRLGWDRYYIIASLNWGYVMRRRKRWWCGCPLQKKTTTIDFVHIWPETNWYFRKLILFSDTTLELSWRNILKE